jgi:hypothetical protein
MWPIPVPHVPRVGTTKLAKAHIISVATTTSRNAIDLAGVAFSGLSDEVAGFADLWAA